MSIPKSPRQIMINLMYLVLTVLLALNISAEILNAFFVVDKGLKKSNEIIGLTNTSILNNLKGQAEVYKEHAPLVEASEKAILLTGELKEYINDLRENLIKASGGYDLKGDDPSLPKNKKDKDVTTRLLVDEKLGEALKAKMDSTRTQLLALITEEEREKIALQLPLKIEDDPKKLNGLSWSEYNFKQMPVAAVLPLFSKWENDAITAETVILNHFIAKTNQVLVFDEFEPVISGKKGYIFKGEEYTADVFLSARSSQVDNVAIRIDGKLYSAREGKALFKEMASSNGSKVHQVEIVVTHPFTKKKKSYKKTFSYEVGERSVAVSATKMNVFYLGVENPVEISVAGAANRDLDVKIRGGNGTIQSVRNGQYVVKVNKETENCEINIKGAGYNETRKFRVKKIPDPFAYLGKSKGGRMSAAEFKAHEGPRPVLKNFDFEATCRILGFELARVPKKGDARTIINPTGRYGRDGMQLRDAASRGDKYFFSNIKVKCPGDSRGREINSMAFTIR